jgi:hypothetical protein
MLKIALAAAAAFALSPAVAATPLHETLRSALACEGDPLDAVRGLAQVGGTAFAQGYAGFELGAEMDHVAGVVLRDPLDIAGARTGTVVATLMSWHAGFGGHVHARFTGDHLPVVESLGLMPDPDGEGFRRSRPVPAEPEAVCPPTIELLPLPDGGFLLGCGWCNG